MDTDKLQCMTESGFMSRERSTKLAGLKSETDDENFPLIVEIPGKRPHQHALQVVFHLQWISYPPLLVSFPTSHCDIEHCKTEAVVFMPHKGMSALICGTVVDVPTTAGYPIAAS